MMAKKRNPITLQARASRLFESWVREDMSLGAQLLEVHGRAYAAFEGYQQMIRQFELDLAEAYSLPRETDTEREMRALILAIYKQRFEQERFLEECQEGLDDMLERMVQARIQQCIRMRKQLDDVLQAHKEGRW